MTASKISQARTSSVSPSFQASMARFASKANHDFREPLAMLKFMVQHLRSGADPAQQEKLFAAADESLSHLQRYTQQLIDYSWLLSEPDDLQIVNTDLMHLIDEAIEDLIDIYPSADIIVDRNTQAHRTASIDKKALRMALSAVIENAIVHGQSSQVLVKIENGQDGSIAICVTDHGPGISPSDVSLIKSPFAQAKRQDVVDTTYFGLGLTIADAACETLGGKLVLDGKVKAGTRVLLHIPA